MAGHSDAGHWQHDGAFANVLSISVVLIHSVDGSFRTEILSAALRQRCLAAFSCSVQKQTLEVAQISDVLAIDSGDREWRRPGLEFWHLLLWLV
jgi:hypothetical protein